MEAAHDLGRAAAHRLDRRAAVAGGHQRRPIRTRRGGDLVGRHVGGDGGAHHPRVDQQNLAAELPDTVAEKRVLGRLGVERAQDHDGCHRAGYAPTGAGHAAARGRRQVTGWLCIRSIDNRLSITVGTSAAPVKASWLRTIDDR
jgi:hypothetical protein